MAQGHPPLREHCAQLTQTPRASSLNIFYIIVYIEMHLKPKLSVQRALKSCTCDVEHEMHIRDPLLSTKESDEFAGKMNQNFLGVP